MDRAAELEARRIQTRGFLSLMRIHREVDRLMAAKLEDMGFHDITPAQANALILLFHSAPPMNARRLAELMGLSQVTVGRFVRALEESHWIKRERDERDSRAILLSLTQKAYAALPEFIRGSNALLDLGYRGLNNQAVNTLVQLIDSIQQNLSNARIHAERQRDRRKRTRGSRRKTR